MQAQGRQPRPWQPRPGWGTIRNYIAVASDHGGTDIACSFVPDDGGQPLPLVFHDIQIPELGEYARAVMTRPDDLSIKVSVASMVEAEAMFRSLNAMEPVKRAHMFMTDNGLYEDCGWAWTPDFRLVKAAPGLVHRTR